MPTYKITDSTTGKKYNFTGDSPPTEDEINSALGISREEAVSSTNTPPKAPGYMARVQEDVSRGMEGIAETGRFMQRSVGRAYTDAFGDDKLKAASVAITLPSDTAAGAIRLASDVVNIATAPVVEGIISLFHGASPFLKYADTAMRATNPLYKFQTIIKEGASNLALAAIDTEAGRQGIAALNSGVDTYREWAKANPDDAKLIGAVINIAPLSRASNAATPTIGRGLFTKITSNLDSAAAKQAAGNRILFLEDLTTPQLTKEVRDEIAANAVPTGGLLQGQRAIPQAEQQGYIDLLYKLPEVNSGNTHIGNRIAVETVNNRQAITIANKLEQPISVGVPAPAITIQEIVTAVNRAVVRESKVNYYGGKNTDNVKVAAAEMRRLIGKNMALGTMSDSGALFQARKEFDQWALDQNPDAFATGNASKQTAAAKAVRDSIHELIISKNPHIDIASSLDMQSKLFGVLSVLYSKGGSVATTNIGRAWQKISVLPGFRNKLSSVLGVATGSGMLGATYYFAPAISIGLAGAITLAIAGKTLGSAQAKTVLSFMLKEVDKTIQSSKVARDIVALQLSKKTIEELINTMDTQDQENPNAVQSQVPSGQPVFISPLAPVSTPPLPGPVAQASPQDMPFNVMQGTGIAQALRPQEAYRQAMTGIGGR